MHVTRAHHEASSHVLSLLAKWSHLATASTAQSKVEQTAKSPAGAMPTAAAAASHLLQDTLQCIRGTPADLPTTTAAPAAAAGSGDAPQPTMEGREILGHRDRSLLIWKTLRRHRVPWEESLALAHAQMLYLPSEAQQHFVTRRSHHRPWTVSRAILASWDWQPDTELTQVYHALKETKTVVSFVQEVAKALRSRPELRQVLPVPLSALLHVYRLSLPPTRPGKAFRSSVPKEKREETARMALEVCRRMALLGESALSLGTKERLVLQHTQLLQQCGEWDRVLQLVSSSPAVRLSVKESVTKYVRERNFWERALQSVSMPSTPAAQGMWVDPAKAIAKAPHWLQALAVVGHHFAQQPGPLLSTWLVREDVPLKSIWETALRWVENVPEDSSLTAEALLKALHAIPSSPSTSAEKEEREGVTAPSASARVEAVVQLVRPSATQLRGGELLSALSRCTSRAWWNEALVLACASRSYDLARGFISHLGGRAGPPLPLEYVEFEKAMLTLRQPDEAAAVLYQPSKDSSLPELLAHALWGNWRRVAQVPRAYTCNRLRSLLSALHASSASEATNLGPVDCYGFEDPKYTQLVCASASLDKRREFLAQLPPSAQRQYRRLVSPEGGVQSILERTLTTREDCVQWCAAAQKELTRTHAPLPTSGVDLLKCIAAKAAAGDLQLRSSERYALALTVLEATAPDRWRLDATTASRAFKSVPAMYSSSSPAGLTSGLRGVLSLAQWEVALQRYTLSVKVARGVQADAFSRKDVSSSSSAPSLLLGGTRAATSGAEKATEARWLDVCAAIALAAPPEVAKRHARYLWRRHDHTLSLLVLELLHGDSRGAAGELRRLSKQIEGVRSQQIHAKRATSAVLRRKETLLLRKQRAVVNAAFTLLNAETPLRFVVRAMGKRHVQATDMDASALQKVLATLPWEAALQTMEEVERSAAYPVEEIWLLHLAVRKDTPPNERAVLRRLAEFLPYAPLLQAVLFVRASVGEKNLIAGLKGLLRVCHLVEQYPYPAPLRRPFALLLELVVEAEWPQEKSAPRSSRAGEGSGCGGEGEELTKQARLARLLFNRLLQVAKYTEKIRPGRMEFALSLKDPSPAAPLLLLHFLFSVVGRQERVPLRASLVSRCLRMARGHTPTDSGAALYFFKLLKRPTVEERMLLVECLRNDDMAPTLLLHTHRFLQNGFVEQIVVWADVTSSHKWEVSLRLLNMRKQAAMPSESSESGEEKKEEDGDATTTGNATERQENASNLDSVKQFVWEQYLSKWDGVECARVLELCKRVGYDVPSLTRPTMDASPLPLPPRRAQGSSFASEMIELIEKRMRTVGRS